MARRSILLNNFPAAARRYGRFLPCPQLTTAELHRLHAASAALKALGFEPHTKGIFEDSLWERRFEELTAFQKQHGHTRVPDLAGRRTPLHSWRIQQRKLRRLGKLAPGRIARLDTLGFEWD